MKNLTKLATFVAIAIVFAGCSQKVTVTAEPSTMNDEPTPVISPDDFKDSELMKESTYLDPNGVFSFTYPEDFTLDTQDPVHPRVFKQGEQQRPQSEMSDGALVVFEVADLGEQTLEEFVDARIKQSTADGTSEVTKEKEATTVNDFAGFTYATRGLGESTNYIIRKDPNSQNALIISTLVADPENSGYQAQVDGILNSVEVLE